MAQFTKEAIIDSFIKLLNKYPLDKITIKDIVEDCGVNRNTFYYYFQDIYALLEEIFKAETQKVIEANGSYSSWQEGFIQSAAFALENKKVIYHVYNSINREHLEQYLYEITYNLMLGFVKEQAKGLRVSDEDTKLIATFYQCALIGMVHEWLRRGMKDDPEYIIRKMGKLLDGNIKYSLTKSNPKKV